jgi:pilus assembly protein CpaB
MAVRINDVAGVAGLIQPNARVDVLVNLRDEREAGRQVAKVFMENMRVLSVGTQVERGQDGQAISATTATLEVTPAEAERLFVAVNSGTLQLVLRGFGDPNSSSTEGARSSDVLSGLRGAIAPPPPQEPAPARRAAEPRRSTVAAAPSAPAPALAAAPRPAAPDSVAVTVFRGASASQQKFVKPDSARKTP